LNDTVKVSYNEYSFELNIEFYETKPHHLRPLLLERINNILNLFDTLRSVNLEDLNLKSSFFAINWTPVKSSNSKFLSSMLTFYQFNYKTESTADDLYDYNFLETVELPIIGVVPLKLDEKLWLNKINNCNKYY